jgi:uncharacterized protein GlcG (DUF336 family)
VIDAKLSRAMALNLHDAQGIIAGAHDKAAELGVRVTVAVVNDAGILMALARMDGSHSLSPQLAESKAVGAAMLHRDGASLADVYKERPGFFNVADRLVRMPIVPGLGSILIKREGKVEGAIGVSGAKPEEDLQCAEAGLASIHAKSA